ncbi:MAG: AAA family ATPase, partial [Caldilineaceae bacterium]|nr:AAA family ATPase [Caldilineaceae bacterium]
MTTRLSFLGPARITVAARDAELTSGKGLALLAYLAGTGAPQTRDHLCDLLWAESHPDAARKNLRNTLWRVRQTVGEDAVITHDDMLLLAGSVWTDVAAFEAGIQACLSVNRAHSGDQESDQLDALLGLWRGPLLEGVNLTDAPDFDLWLSSERVRLGQLYGAGLNLRLTQHRAAARWQDVVTVARQALAHDNTQESIHTCLMEAYAQLGQRTNALRQYDTLRTVLEQELGATPLAQTHALRQSILAGTHNEDSVSTVAASPMTAPRLTASSVTAPIDTRPPRARPPIRRPFVGRAAEQLTLDEIHRRANDGRLQIALISGETGMGKSTLWQQWSHRLAPGASVLEARCLHSTQTLPFAPLTGLFDTESSLARLARHQSPSFAVWLT